MDSPSQGIPHLKVRPAVCGSVCGTTTNEPEANRHRGGVGTLCSLLRLRQRQASPCAGSQDLPMRVLDHSR
jgi:hypothetical protein